MRDAESLAKPTVLLSPPVALEYDRYVAFPRIVPIAPVRVREPFDHRDWIFEPKLDGFRALAYVADGSCTLLSRRGHAYKAFAPLATAMAAALGNQQLGNRSSMLSCSDARAQRGKRVPNRTLDMTSGPSTAPKPLAARCAGAVGP
jgi:hypothetical protein